MVAQQLGISILLFALSTLVGGCAGGAVEGALTDKEKNTLDRALQRLVQGDTSDVEQGRVGMTEEGRGIYAVFIHVNDREAFRESAIPVNSWSGSIATARLTVEEIRRAARMEVVESIRLSGRAEAHE